ncbi:PilZ domain-containing protein [Geoalkalibacter halelectricus]|uniref:PilZ domain-containing protein n=1 Tax=Geoalkalibacter halelectricus TaxID=2847045 RepID=A0ABY5ZR75_9BACT|nr:PilZ domain-containing protein [Geoalkalibacter halelectricus]MDO3376709.1 PilZ domain-containing protein [Geoalkalibacter halelectricus]UWZ81339.1 PilZ domain-containing protein [Geoalkalibacter halelectricus]
MKRVLIASGQQSLMSNLDLVLKHWGYRPLSSSHRDDICGLLHASEPELVIFDAPWLRQHAADLLPLVPQMERLNMRLAVLDDCREKVPLLSNGLPYKKIPSDIFSLYGLTQAVLQHHPRRRLRTGVHLPGMLRRNGRPWDMTQILTLGTGGMFIRSGFRLQRSETLQMCVPLFGLKEELEAVGRVVYEIHPTLENNYIQGYGIEFTSLSPQSQKSLSRFVAGCFLRDLEHPQPVAQPPSPSYSMVKKVDCSLAGMAF